MEVLTTKVSEVMMGDKKTDESEMVQLKEKFHSTSKNSVRIQILTVMQNSWCQSLTSFVFVPYTKCKADGLWCMT